MVFGGVLEKNTALQSLLEKQYAERYYELVYVYVLISAILPWQHPSGLWRSSRGFASMFMGLAR